MNQRNNSKKWSIISKIAIYGKGGIGKSTISANISAALADEGYTILHIGCDPKHDSTRALLGELQIITVTDSLKKSEEYEISSYIRTGYKGVSCVEAGGPEPGVGCAGRGILRTFELIDRMEGSLYHHSYTIYDVLGDVVCGGFAVPLRHEYADLILIVTSGEYMSLYAANNILRGIRNFDGERGRIGGIIYNSRGGIREEEQVKRFSQAVKLPILITIPRSELFLSAERLSRTVIEEFPDSYETSIFRELVAHLSSDRDPLPRHTAFPLEIWELESLILERKQDPLPIAIHDTVSAKPIVNMPVITDESHSYNPERPPLFGCAFAGAVAVLSQIEDATLIAHCPTSCAHILSNLLISAQNRNKFQITTPRYYPKSFLETGMDERMMVFGGEQMIKQAIVTAAENGSRIQFIISSCAPGVIGDDITGYASTIAEQTGLTIIPVPVHGVLAGDFTEGMLSGSRAATQIIKRDLQKIDKTVVILGEKVLANNTSLNFNEINRYLSFLNITVVCRFLSNTSIDEIQLIGNASLILPVSNDETTQTIATIISEITGVDIFPCPFPYTFHSTSRWIKALSDYFNVTEKGEALISEQVIRYQKEIDVIKLITAGKRVIIASSGPDITWALEILHECEIEVIIAGYFSSPYNSKQTFISHDSPILLSYTVDQLYEDIGRYSPDLVLTTISLDNKKCNLRYGMIPFCPNTGFYGALQSMKHWADILTGPVQEGWRNDL